MKNLVVELLGLKAHRMCTGSGVNTTEGFVYAGACGGMYLALGVTRKGDGIHLFYDFEDPFFGLCEEDLRSIESWAQGTEIWSLETHQAIAMQEYEEAHAKEKPKRPKEFEYKHYKIVRYIDHFEVSWPLSEEERKKIQIIGPNGPESPGENVMNGRTFKSAADVAAYLDPIYNYNN